MSTDQDMADQNDPTGDESILTTLTEHSESIDIEEDELNEDAATEDTATEDTATEDAATEDTAAEDDATEDEEDLVVGEWSLCASMIFLAGYLVLIMFWLLGHPVWETIISVEWEVYRTTFPVGVATILLLISVLSAFCSFISLVADKNNKRTNIVRLLTLGPLLPTATAVFLIWIIVQRGAGNSILENFLG